MIDYEAIPVGSTETIDDQGSAAQVHRAEKNLYVIKRHSEGGWMRRVWVRGAGSGWRVAKEEQLIPVHYSDDLQEAINDGIVLSRLTTG